MFFLLCQQTPASVVRTFHKFFDRTSSCQETCLCPSVWEFNFPAGWSTNLKSSCNVELNIILQRVPVGEILLLIVCTGLEVKQELTNQKATAKWKWKKLMLISSCSVIFLAMWNMYCEMWFWSSRVWAFLNCCTLLSSKEVEIACVVSQQSPLASHYSFIS